MMSQCYVLLFMVQDDGTYDGFDPKEFTSRSHGKAAAIREIKVGTNKFLQ